MPGIKYHEQWLGLMKIMRDFHGCSHNNSLWYNIIRILSIGDLEDFDSARDCNH